MLYKAIFNIGQYVRNPSIKKWLQFLKKSENWPLKELEKYQLKQLQELVAAAYIASPYYKKSFDKVGVKPSDIKYLEDVKKLPIITKSELLEFNKQIHTDLKFSKTFFANTSGSSGESLKFKRDESADSFNRAAIFRGYSWYNVEPWECNGYFWGFNFSKKEKLKVAVLDALQNRFRLFDYQKSAVKSFLRKLQKASYLHGYSSMIYETAKMINQNEYQKPRNLKMIKGTSEKIYESYQEEVKKAYGTKIISEYGATESGIIAFECPHGNMHINMEGVLVEEIDTEIVVTNLQMKSFPIIRYKLGDYIKLSDETCACGRHHKIIDEVTGRIGATVYGKIQTYPSLYYYYIFKNLAKKEGLFLTYQVVQNKKGNLEFLIEQSLNPKEFQLLENEIKIYFNEDIEYQIKSDSQIKNEHEKLKSFISTVKE